MLPEVCAIIVCDMEDIEPDDSRVVVIQTFLDNRFFFVSLGRTENCRERDREKEREREREGGRENMM